MTGYPWTNGDQLFAADLNAAIALSAPPVGATFLLTTGGTMTGPITLAGNATLPLHAVPLQQLPLASSTLPGMDSSTAAIGVGTTWARADHVHPTDTSRYAATNPAAYVNAAGAAAAAPVQSVATRTGAITLTHTDITDWSSAISAGTSGYLPLTGGTVSGTLNVTTTGTGTISRSVQDRFAEIVDIHDYGQVGVNAATDTATFLAAVAALPSNGAILWIGGTNINGITLNQTITITKPCKILGAAANGWCSTIVCAMSGPAILFSDPTPSYQKTFEVENVRFVANASTGATQSAIQVNVGPASSQTFPSFIGRNLTFNANTASAASPYAQTFTRGIEFVPASVSGTAGFHNFWNIVLENVMFVGTTDSSTGQPIAGTAGIAFGQVIYGSFRNVHASIVASALHQTDYCEGITCLSCQLFNCTNGWDQGSFAPVGASQIKLLQPVLIASMIQATQAAINLDCVYIGVFQGNYLTGSGATNVLLSNAQSTQLVDNYIISGTIGISLTKGSYNQGWCMVSRNILSNITTTHISLGSGAYGNSILDNMTDTGAAPTVVDNGTANAVRATIGPLTLGDSASTDTELKLLGAPGTWRTMSIWSGTTATAGLRWVVGTGTSSEGGSNAGSDFQIESYNDSGVGLSTPLTITRASGLVHLWNGLQVSGSVSLPSGGLSITVAAGSATDVVNGLSFGGGIGINTYSANLNLTAASGSGVVFYAGSSNVGYINMSGLTVVGGFGVHGASASATKPTVTGSKGANAALTSLMTALASYGLVTDSTT